MARIEGPAEQEGFASFQALIGANARARPADIAFQVDEDALDWQTLESRSTQVARALMSEGIAAGDRVAVLGSPSLAYVELLFGTVAARACVVPLPLSASVETLEALIADCDARLVFVDASVGEAVTGPSGLVERLSQRETLRVLVFGEGLRGEEYTAWRSRATVGPLPEARAEDRFNIIYSSGTTGLPKGIVHLHGMRGRQAGRNGFGLAPESRTLLSTPMYSNTTILPMLATVAHGGRSILMQKFDSGRYLALAARHGATHTMLVPVQYQRILSHADFDGARLRTLQLSQSTGAPMDARLKQAILDRWPGRFLEIYGLTEGGVTCVLDARLHPDKLHTVGRPAFGTEVLLIDASGQPLPRDLPGAVGEVVGQSPFMMAGYHDRPEATEQIRFQDEQGRVYHRSGDIGRFDADGFLVLLDRIKDVIISGGHNIYASDLEAVLARHPDVQDVAVLGVPSTRWGETPLALVVPHPNALADAAALCDWANRQVGKTQRLSAVELRDSLPRNALGKLSKKELRAPYWQRADVGGGAPA